MTASPLDPIDASVRMMSAIADAQTEFFERMLAAPGNEWLAELVHRWTDLQREMLVGWLALAEGSRGAASMDELQAAGNEMADALRGAAEHLVNSQGDWAKAWTAAS